MIRKLDHDNRNDPDPDHANDNGEEREDGAIAPPPAGGALTSLAALQTALANVNTAAVVGRTGLPMMLFKREGDGTWGFGQQRTIPEEGSKWAVNPLTFKWGAICFNDARKVVGERLVPVSLPQPVITELPDTGFRWQEEWAVNMKCLDGADAGVEVVFKATTDGGVRAIAIAVDLVRDRLDGGRHDGKVVPIMLLEKNSYLHSEHGKVWFPVLNNVGWMSLDGPAPASASAPASSPSQPAQQPRRRRVG